MRNIASRFVLVLFLSFVLSFQTTGFHARAASAELPNSWVVAAYGDNTQVFVPNDINGQGVVVGALQMPDGFYPALLVDGEISLLGDGTEQGGAAAVNEDG